MWNTQGWLSLLCLVTFIATLFFNYTASTGLITKSGVGEVSDKYELPITPASWTFSIWAFIYIWQFLWIIYLLYFSCKYSSKLNNAILFHSLFYILFTLSNIGNSLWIIVWTNEWIIPAAIILPLTTLVLYACAFIAHKYLLLKLKFYSSQQPDTNYTCMEPIQDNERSFFEYLNSNPSIQKTLYGLVLNGIPFYATWCTIASCLNIGIALAYEANKSNININTPSIVMLSILSLIIAAYWFLDFYLLKSYLKYTFSPYIVLIYAFSGVLTNDYDWEGPKIFTLVLIIIAVIGSIIKVVISVSLIRKQDYEVPV